jgi:DNA-binding MarR family transcriptional regulator
MADLEDLAVGLALAVARLARRLDARKAPGLTIAELAVLAGLEAGASSLTALAAREQIRPPSAIRPVGTLQGRGLLTREPYNGGGRKVPIALTGDGRKALAAARDGFWLAAAVRELPEDEQQVLRDALPLLDRLCATPPGPSG